VLGIAKRREQPQIALDKSRRDPVMAWDIQYRLGEVQGFHSTETREAAIKRACDLLDQGAEIISVRDEGMNEVISVGQKTLASQRRHH
jgi:hypothetical protein